MTKKFQSTHPRGVRPVRYSIVLVCLLVSIHAPAWGATLRIEGVITLRLVSIHAPAWGATIGLRLCFRQQHVSIHAPAWGATLGGGLRPSYI